MAFPYRDCRGQFLGVQKGLDAFLEEENQSRAINYKDTATGLGHAIATNHWKLEKCSWAVSLQLALCSCVGSRLHSATGRGARCIWSRVAICRTWNHCLHLLILGPPCPQEPPGPEVRQAVFRTCAFPSRTRMQQCCDHTGQHLVAEFPQLFLHPRLWPPLFAPPSPLPPASPAELRPQKGYASRASLGASPHPSGRQRRARAGGERQAGIVSSETYGSFLSINLISLLSRRCR